MPPVLIRRKDGEVREVPLSGTPLGTLSHSYREETLALTTGDTLLIMSDGFPELQNRAGEPFGYERVAEALRDAAGTPRQVIENLVAVADEWAAGEPQHDDVTFVVVQVA
jgi:sigma-B regulation protein RsbU (phosphoserine phosphatase)